MQSKSNLMYWKMHKVTRINFLYFEEGYKLSVPEAIYISRKKKSTKNKKVQKTSKQLNCGLAALKELIP